MKVSGKQTGNKAFEITQDGFTYTLDATKEAGGEEKGPTPKGLLLSSIIGCSGIDVSVILDKMRVPYEHLEITAETEQTEGEPKVFKDITLQYHIRTDTPDEKKIKRAVQLSMEKYCGVTAMLEKHSKIHYEIYLNGKKLAQ